MLWLQTMLASPSFMITLKKRSEMKSSVRVRSLTAFLLVVCLLCAPITALARKGEKNYKRGLQYEAAQQWEKAAQEFTLAVAADPSNMEYQLHYRRSLFNASQMFMQQGRALAEQKDFVGAYNAFRQAYGYDPVNQLALSEMARMLRLQAEKTGEPLPTEGQGDGSVPTSAQQGGGSGSGATPARPSTTRNVAQEPVPPPSRSEQLRIINYSGDLKSFIRSLAEQLGLNIIFDRQSFAQPRTIDINLRDVTTAQALDFIFLQEGLFFQKLSRRTVLVADQGRRAQYQQLVIRTFYLSNAKPSEAKSIIQQAIPPSQGRPQIIVINDDATNSLTVRDTAENVRLIGEILKSIDKDRAEVVMDVNIYEVSRSDLLQFGNQLGTVDQQGNVSVNIGGTSALAVLGGSRQVASQALGGIPTALGAALIVPPSSLTALQRKDHTRLVASTQVHAFNGEESQARIGQRVPVQTAQTYPFGFQSGGGQTTTPGGNFQFPSGGFPVINYEPTGLTLKFTPQVFPNFDVQVKMSIESKDVLNPGSNTPTFTERTISGTARIQNNRTMMLASVAQDRQSNGRQGIPLLGLIPILGRLFTSPRRDNFQTDIVIAVTPRVLRAPAVTPRDEELRPSGTLSSPTIGTVEAMIREEDRDDQLAAARRIPREVTVQLPDAEAPAFVPAPKALLGEGGGGAQQSANVPNVAASNTGNTSAQTPAANPQPALSTISNPPGPTQGNALANALTLADRSTAAAPVPRPIDVAATLKQVSPELSSNAPALTFDKSEPATATPRVMDIDPPSVKQTPAASSGPAGLVELRLTPEKQEMRAGQKQRVALSLGTIEQLGSATFKLRFDSRSIAVRGISQGSLLTGASGTAPTLLQSIDPAGSLFISVQTPAGTPLKTGMNILLFIEIEALASGESEIVFEQETIRLATQDGRNAAIQLVPARLSVKQ
ncbi:MAG TPA: secretin N-terminal domain-containing protein [Pyrinomonadaceae bacterium]|jgi:general secretion pathway protein D